MPTHDPEATVIYLRNEYYYCDCNEILIRTIHVRFKQSRSWLNIVYK